MKEGAHLDLLKSFSSFLQDIYVRSLNTFNFNEFVTVGHQSDIRIQNLDLSFSHKNYKKTIHVYF